MQKPTTSNNAEEDRRSEVVRLRSAIKAAQQLYSRETSVEVKATVQVEMAVLQRQLQDLLNEMGLAGVKTKKGRPMTAKQAEMHLPTQEMTPAMIADLAAAGLATPEGAASLRNLAAQGPDRPLVVPWQVPQMPKAPDVPSIAQFMAECRSFKALQPVQRVEKDPHFKKGGGITNFATNKPGPQWVGQDAEWVSLLQQMGLNDFSEKVYELLKEAVAEYYVGSGPLDGWFARLKAGDAIKRPQFTLSDDEDKQVISQLPHSQARVQSLKDLTLKEAFGTIKVNATADAGFPRCAKKGMCMAELMADAAQYFDLMSAKGFNEYARKNPGEFLSVCKNKHDRYEISDIGKKIRPYFNSNGGMALLYSIVMQNYAHALLGFWEDRNSCNAHGFAWNSGGGQRLYDWVAWAAKQKPGVYAIGYSDDGLWVIVCEDGTVLISDKDIAQCDFSLGQSHRTTFVKHFRHVVGDKYGAGWNNIAQAAINNVWTQVVVLYGSLVYLSTDKVHSGGVGTAEADQIGFSTMLALIRRAYSTAKGTPLERFQVAEEEVQKRTGLRFKPSQWHEFKENQDEYPWSFLGKRIIKMRGSYYPHVDLKKCVVQLITPKRNQKGDIGQCAWLERARGLGVTSLWTHPELYEYVKTVYERKYIAGVRPKPTFDGADVGEEDLEQLLGTGVTVSWPSDKFPERSWVQSLYAPPGTAREVKPGEKPIQVVLVANQPTMEDALDEMFPEQDAHLWADRDDRALEVRGQAAGKLGDGQRVKPPELRLVNPGPQQYNAPPLPQHIKDAFNEARAKARIALRLAGVSAGRVKKGGKLQRLEQGDFQNVVFTRQGIVKAYEDAAEEDVGDDFPVEEEWVDDQALDDERERRYWSELERAYERDIRKGK